MLFFVKGEAKGAVPLPPEQLLELAVKEWETVISYSEQGKALAGGALAGGKGGCGIWNVQSAEELHTLLSQLPGFPLCEWEIIPLIPVEYALEWTKQALAAVRASK
jgi:muconolactone D-isomerase